MEMNRSRSFTTINGAKRTRTLIFPCATNRTNPPLSPNTLAPSSSKSASATNSSFSTIPSATSLACSMTGPTSASSTPSCRHTIGVRGLSFWMVWLLLLSRSRCFCISHDGKAGAGFARCMTCFGGGDFLCIYVPLLFGSMGKGEGGLQCMWDNNRGTVVSRLM